MSWDYIVVGVVLVLIGGFQIWMTRRGWEGDGSRRWTGVLGPAAIVLGLVTVAAGLMGW